MSLTDTLDEWRKSVTAEILILLGPVSVITTVVELFPVPMFPIYVALCVLVFLGGLAIVVWNLKEQRNPKPERNKPYGRRDYAMAFVLWAVSVAVPVYFTVNAYDANSCPEVKLVVPPQQRLEAGDKVTLKAEVTDNEGDSHLCRWSAFFGDGSDAHKYLSAGRDFTEQCETTFTAPSLAVGSAVTIYVDVDDGKCGHLVSASHRKTIQKVQGAVAGSMPTQTATPAPSHTPPSTHTSTPTSTHTPTPTFTLTPVTTTKVPTSTSAPETPTITPTLTVTATLTPPPSPTPRPAARWLPAPELLEPYDGQTFVGWNAKVILRWSPVVGRRVDEYYIVRIVYNDRGEETMFWRQDTWLKVPEHFSSADDRFPDFHYEWTVQTMRCTNNCAKALDDGFVKDGVAVGDTSRNGRFYWHPDLEGGPTSSTGTDIKPTTAP